MKKIAILSTVNIKHMTLISLYTDFLTQHNIPYDIIYIDKYNEIEKIDSSRSYKYNLKINRDWNIIKKIKHYYKFKKFAKDIIKENNYDFLVVWNSFTGLLFFDFLIKNFRKKYSLNIRDYAKEKSKIIYFLMKLVIKNAAFTTISSEGFKNFLPKHEYVIIHSFNSNLLPEHYNEKREQKETLNITFIGYVRFYEMDKKLIKALGNDNRFKLFYHGEGSLKLQEYAEEQGIKNVVCTGRFEPSETTTYLENADIVNNLYGTNTPGLKNALSIKLYYATHYKLPILVFRNTFMEKISSKYNFSIPIENLEKENLGDYIYTKYNKLDIIDLEQGTNDFKKRIKEDNRNFYYHLNKYLL